MSFSSRGLFALLPLGEGGTCQPQRGWGDLSLQSIPDYSFHMCSWLLQAHGPVGGWGLTGAGDLWGGGWGAGRLDRLNPSDCGLSCMQMSCAVPGSAFPFCAGK